MGPHSNDFGILRWEDPNFSTRQYGHSKGKQSYKRPAGEPAGRLSFMLSDTL